MIVCDSGHEIKYHLPENLFFLSGFYMKRIA